MVAGALEQKVWAFTAGSNIYPNLYVCLVGPPGSGKGEALNFGDKIMRIVPDIHLAPSSVSDASLIDTIHDAKRSIVRMHDTPNHVEFNHLTVISLELGLFLPQYDRLFMNTMQQLYDKVPYEQRRRTKAIHIKIPSPQLNFLAGTNPAYLNEFLPEGAWDQGFTARTIFVYSGEKSTAPLFTSIPNPHHTEDIFKAIIHDLTSISRLYGKVDWSEEAVIALTAWDEAGGPPVPDQPKLSHYVTRRTAHLIKLCMIACASRDNTKRIELEDYQTALDWLLEAESTMPDIFANMGVGGDSKAIDDTWYYIYTQYRKTKVPVFENAVYAYLRDRVASHSIPRVIEVMVRSGMLRIEPVRGLQAYVPANKRKL